MRSSYCGINREDVTLDINRGEIDARHKEMGWVYDYPRHFSQRSRFCKQDCHQSKNYVAARTELNPTWLAESCLMPVGDCCPIAKEVHLENIRRSLERRLRVAKASGDNYLAKLLEDESSQFDPVE